MAKSEEQLQEELVNRYLKNLDFFRTYDLELFNKIETLSTAINEGLYQEKHALEFIKEIKDFDILNLENNSYLYNKNMKKVNHNLQKEITFDKKAIFSTLNKGIYDEYIKNYDLPNTKFDLLDNYLLEDMSEYRAVFSEMKEGNYKFIDKIIFLGTALGGHLNSIKKNTNVKLCLIYEPNLEIFRLSLFTTDYFTLSSNTKLIFSVMDYNNIFINKLNQFISSYAQFSNYNIKYSKMNYITGDVIHNIISQLHISNSNLYDYTKVLYQNIYTVSKHLGRYKILCTKNKKNDFSLTKGKPVLFVGAGPSLMKNIKWLKENQDSFCIVSMGATYKKLFENDIRVDIVSTVDPQYEVLNNTHFNEEDVILLKDTIVLASICTPTKILNRFNQKKLFLFETYQSFKDSSNCYNGASIGEVTLSILLDLKIENIYLFGIDLALDSNTGSTHYEGYQNQEKGLFDKAKVNSILSGQKQDLRDEYLEIEGNKNKKVITTRVFALSINMYSQVISQFRQNKQKIYNLSSEGAYIEGTEFIEIDNINLEKEKAKLISEDLFKELVIISEKDLTIGEKAKLNKRILFTDNLALYLSASSENLNSKNLEEFNVNVNLVIAKVLESNDYSFTNIIANYLNLSLPFIYSNLNNNKISKKDERNKIKTVEKVLYKHLMRIIEIYNYYLKQI